MSYVTVFDSPAGSIENMQKVVAEIGQPPQGLAARYAGMSDGRLRVVAVWDSQAHADAFFAGYLGPALAKVLGPEPTGRPTAAGMEVLESYTR